MSAPKPEPISHTAEMVIATVVGVGVGLGPTTCCWAAWWVSGSASC